MSSKTNMRPQFDLPLVRRALGDSLRKLHPGHQIRNPVMFVVLVGAILTLGLFFHALGGAGEAPAAFILAISLWLWFTLIFANFAEAMAEGRGKAQAEALKQSRRTILRAGVTAAPSRAARVCCPTGSSSASRPTPARVSSIA